VAKCAYVLGKGHWGKGLATEATSALLGFVFDRFDTDVVEADHFDDNPASGRVLAKLGFEKIGQGTGTSAARLEPTANTHYRLIRQNFEAHHEIS
ncbi:MAG: GNAT family N-acetyltransferase, partial [Pseudomonadota bacterium]|nr:GNAT family N-acetyltransferase [Pseudomonadota bacterium]